MKNHAWIKKVLIPTLQWVLFIADFTAHCTLSFAHIIYFKIIHIQQIDFYDKLERLLQNWKLMLFTNSRFSLNKCIEGKHRWPPHDIVIFTVMRKIFHKENDNSWKVFCKRPQKHLFNKDLETNFRRFRDCINKHSNALVMLNCAPTLLSSKLDLQPDLYISLYIFPKFDPIHFSRVPDQIWR